MTTHVRCYILVGVYEVSEVGMVLRRDEKC